MKDIDKNLYFEKLLYMAVEKEKQRVPRESSRIDYIMNEVNELINHTKIEAQLITPKFAFVYAISIAASVLIGCIIGNMVSNPVNALQVSYESFDLINIGLNNNFLPF